MPTAAADGRRLNGLARFVSLAASSAASAVLLLYPYALGTRMTPATHSALPLLFLGVSSGFVHGVGFRPENRALRILFSPAAAWPLMAIGAALLALG